jgi:hypothetical protein
MPPRYAFSSLTPMYGLGSGSRTVGAITISSPRSNIGSAGRIYSYLKRTAGSQAAFAFFQDATFGPFIIRNNRLVYN